ncbi:hypothetical protein [Aquimarina sp. AU119]|uniref:hypothetical protein n=1 Tax=Aquimarina sp. AU119 TaxID=2108528 RepID=UPI000D69E28E|nr:hypothetical protein [Aquimarina sp. AU119]
MKKLSFFLLASLLLVIIGCSSDDDSPTGGNDVASNPEEETVLNPADVTSGITIENATVNNGTPPSPTGEIAFTMDNTNQSAFLKNGFDISFNAPANYAGAYIQLASTDGTKATNYFDVSANKSKSVRKNTGVFSRSSKMDNNNVEIDVNFGDAIPPGKFCYILCIYDDAGNISDPVEVCVEIEAWGGNPALVGTWNYTKLIEDGVTILPGEESDCGSTTINCANEQELVIENAFCYILDSFKLTINNDGTYEYRSDETDNDLDFNASTETCTAVFQPEGTSYYISKGNWAYDEEEKRMTLIEFEYVEASGDQVFEGVEENGYVDFDGDAVVDGSSLIVKIVETEADNTINLEYYFSK